MDSQVSLKNTKTQILDAYSDLLESIQSKKDEEPKKVQEQKHKNEITDKAKSFSNEKIVTGISELKVSMSSALDKLGEQFIDEFKKFEDLQKAIDIEKQNLEDLYSLSANTDSLAAMLLAQKEKREIFEQEMEQRKVDLTTKIASDKEKHETEMAEKKAVWKKEQEEHNTKAKEETAITKKDRNREEEEYQYNLKISRKKEANTYEEKKTKLEKDLAEKKIDFEKEFSERKAAIEEAEAELKELRIKSSSFQAELENAVTTAIKSTTDKLETEHQFEIKLSEKEVEGEIKLKDQTITALNSKIKEIEISQKEMSQKTAKAESSVKDIAMKAIESASAKPIFVEKEKPNE